VNAARTDRLQDYLTRSAQRSPEAIALVGGDEVMTYGELEAAANRLAHALIDQGCQPGDRVAVVAAKTPWTIAGLIAVLKAGGAYVPVDSASPPARVARIVRAAEPALLLADATATALVDGLVEEGIDDLVVAALAEPLAGQRFASAFARADLASLSARTPTVASPELAHLLFTSGSTGVPKGVMIEHANVVAFVEWALRHFGTRAGDRISGHPPLHFDLSTFDIYATLAAGAQLHLAPATLGLDPKGTARFIRDRELTQWFSVPSVLTYLARFDAVAHNDFPALKRLLWCGEVLPTPVLAHWMRRLPHVRFTNLYGPTEATIASSYYDVPAVPPDESVPVPIGLPCDGERLLVLTDGTAGSPARVGEIGELYIGGVGLSPGYWRDEEKTAAAFRADPQDATQRIYRTGDLARVDEDGIVHFLGRTDSQIKSRGYRIELGEIEAAVNTVAGVRECAVVGVDTGGFEGTTICCAYSVADGAALPAADMRTHVTKLIPRYMLPARWEVLDALPKNINGKVDRPALRERFSTAATTAAATRATTASRSPGVGPDAR
jgi:amino acid adenylation domain-containing protein